MRTFSVAFHPTSCIDGVSKQAVPWHFQTDDTGTNRSCQSTEVLTSLNIIKKRVLCFGHHLNAIQLEFSVVRWACEG